MQIFKFFVVNTHLRETNYTQENTNSLLLLRILKSGEILTRALIKLNSNKKTLTCRFIQINSNVPR